MKLSRLESSNPCRSSESGDHRHQLAGAQVRRVESPEAAEADRQRSLQQDLAEFDAKAVGPFAGGKRVLQAARELAAQLISLGEDGGSVIRAGSAAGKIDDKA